MTECPYCWTSHGCDLPADHTGPHECRLGHPADDPDVVPRGHPDVFHCKTDEPESAVSQAQSLTTEER